MEELKRTKPFINVARVQCRQVCQHSEDVACLCVSIVELVLL